MKASQPTPPKWAERFLCWYCRSTILEDLQGDLHEYFERNVKTKGVKRAQLIYILDVIKFFRIYTVRKPEFINLLIHWIMLGSYIKTSGRSIVRNKLFSGINIIGLAISMSVGLLVIALISDFHSYDNFHENKDRIYRVTTAHQHSSNPPMNLATSSVLAGKRIKESVTGVEKVTLMRRGFGGDAKVDETVIPLSGIWADDAFFSIFTFPLLQGNPAAALKDPYSIVLTETSARKLFGSQNALGQSVKFDSVNYIVTGVMKDIPKLSHMYFDLLVSFATVDLMKPDMDGGYMSWNNVYSNYTYILLPPDGDVNTVQASIDKISNAENKALEDQRIKLNLQPLGEIPLKAKFGNPIGPSMNGIALWVLGGLALVIIMSACFNYTNLSIARSLRRSREVGIRKVMGARKLHVLGQFVVEAVLIALLALLVSFGIFIILRSEFLSMEPKLQQMLSLELSPERVLQFVLLAVTVGLLAGIAPALFFARVNIIKVLKDVSSLQVFRHVNMRKTLIVVQYTFSLIFITTTIIGYNQYKGFISYDLGFSTENIVNIKLSGGVKGDLLVKELKELPEVTGISRSLMVTSLGSIHGMQVKYKNDSSSVWLNLIDENYLSLHQHKFLAGRNIHAIAEGAEESEVIVNEQLLKRFDIAKRDPAKALGEELMVDGKRLTIVGVVKDFNYGTLENTIEPLIMRYASIQNYGHINLRVQTEDWPATFVKLDAIWQKLDKVHPLEAKFYSDQIQEAYNQFSVMVKVFGFLAFLAVCIASMGLLGMVVFATETRLKEVSIRKVLGASEATLVYMLSKGFVMLLVVAACIALPATYFFFDKVVLVEFMYHAPIHISELVLGFFIVMLVALFMIGSQTLRAARANPADVLKSE
jgi:putative ABC transport system permease protein